MKSMQVTLTDEEADHVEATARDQGLSPDDLLHAAVSAYLREFPRGESETPKSLEFIGIGASGQADTASHQSAAPAGDDQRPDLWFVGLFSGNESLPFAPEEDPGLRRRIARAIWEDSFGGTRPWTEPDDPTVDEDALGDDADSTR